MQNFRLLVVGLAVSSLPFLARADDTAAQAAARAALMEKMNEMDNGQTNPPMVAPTPPTPPPVAAPAPPVTATQPSAETNMPPAVPPPQVIVSPQLAAHEQATNAVTPPSKNEMTQSPANPPMTAPKESATQPGAKTNMPPVAPQMAASPTPARHEQPTNEVAPSSVNEMTQYPVNPPMTSSPQTNLPPITVPPLESPSPVAPPPVATTTNLPARPAQPNVGMVPQPQAQPPTPSGLSPIVPPPLPISAEKQAELQDLLSRYMADQISPSQYQDERAKILAQPN